MLPPIIVEGGRLVVVAAGKVVAGKVLPPMIVELGRLDVNGIVEVSDIGIVEPVAKLVTDAGTVLDNGTFS